jgi:hypothetical protein
MRFEFFQSPVRKHRSILFEAPPHDKVFE